MKDGSSPMSDEQRVNPATVDDPELRDEFLAGFQEGRPDSGTTGDVSRPMSLTVEQLMLRLGKMPADALVMLTTRHGEAEEFTVEYDDDSGWVTLAG